MSAPVKFGGHLFAIESKDISSFNLNFRVSALRTLNIIENSRNQMENTKISTEEGQNTRVPLPVRGFRINTNIKELIESPWPQKGRINKIWPVASSNNKQVLYRRGATN